MDTTPSRWGRPSTSKEVSWLFDESLDQENNDDVKVMHMTEFLDVESSSDSVLELSLNSNELFVESHLELLDLPGAPEEVTPIETPMARDPVTALEKEFFLRIL